MQKAQHAVGGSGQKPDDRPHDHRQPVHHPAGEACHRQRLLHGDALGHQLAQNQREIRQNDGDDDDRQRVQRAGGKRPEAQVLIHPVHQVFGKAVRRESAAQKARQRDADLNGGQKARGRLHHFQKPPGLCVAFLRHSPQLGRVQRNDRDLRHGEKRVEKNQNCLQQQLPSNVIHCFSPLSFEKTIKGTARLPCGRQTMPCSIQFGPGARRRRQRRP